MSFTTREQKNFKLILFSFGKRDDKKYKRNNN